MAEARVERRLAAILAADVAGYSRLIGLDEEGTVATLKAVRREVTDPKIAEHRGRIVKTMGDGVLVEFASAVDAVRCAVEIQRAMAECNAAIGLDRQIQCRIGINVGDIIIDEGDLLGDGVNIAARVEPLASPGAICLSDNAYAQIKGKLALDVSDMGEQHLKNIAEPVRVYSVRFDTVPSHPVLALPDKPSIAVLPFQNMSGDPEQDYFCDGMVEDIITGLSRINWLFVIARNSSFTYKGRAVDVRAVGRELGVRYVLEGSVRKAANRVRITGQLLDASSGSHLWAEQYEGTLQDVFDLQDKITESVVGAIEPSVRSAEIVYSLRKRPENLNAYDLYLRALPHAWANSYAEAGRAIELLDAALKIDPNYAAARGLAAWCHGQRIRRDPSAPNRALEHANRVVASLTDDAIALALAGFALALATKLDAALAAASRVMEINPNSATVLTRSALVNALAGYPEVAISQARRSIRLSPLDPQRYSSEIALSIAFFCSGRFAESAEAARRAIKYNPAYDICHCLLAANYVRLARMQDARRIVAHILEIEPTRRIANLKYLSPALREALREAGLPE
jgi:TolB-like protein/class 3 adenylate cyclase